MATVEINVLCENCLDYCDGFTICPEDFVKECVHLEHCKRVKTVVIQEIYDKFERMHHEALQKPAGLKEPETWLKAIDILEGMLDG